MGKPRTSWPRDTATVPALEKSKKEIGRQSKSRKESIIVTEDIRREFSEVCEKYLPVVNYVLVKKPMRNVWRCAASVD